ncbi:hypothetical protein [Microcoleus anatoxicus]|uniref:Uncharacterized protein n=1 Tax=Microcoleus anatoxicus PTRS2 TaxID=2705321 RepID=A0ABU8YR56_9CYAN
MRKTPSNRIAATPSHPRTTHFQNGFSEAYHNFESVLPDRPQGTQAITTHEHTRPQPLSGCSHSTSMIHKPSAQNPRRSH